MGIKQKFLWETVEEFIVFNLIHIYTLWFRDISKYMIYSKFHKKSKRHKQFRNKVNTPFVLKTIIMALYLGHYMIISDHLFIPISIVTSMVIM